MSHCIRLSLLHSSPKLRSRDVLVSHAIFLLGDEQNYFALLLPLERKGQHLCAAAFSLLLTTTCSS